MFFFDIFTCYCRYLFWFFLSISLIDRKNLSLAHLYFLREKWMKIMCDFGTRWSFLCCDNIGIKWALSCIVSFRFFFPFFIVDAGNLMKKACYFQHVALFSREINKVIIQMMFMGVVEVLFYWDLRWWNRHFSRNFNWVQCFIYCWLQLFQVT